MTKTETIALMKMIKDYYPLYYQKNDSVDGPVILWAKVLEKEDFLMIQKGLERFVTTDRKGYPPVPGQIITLAAEIRKEEWDKRQREIDMLPEPETKGVPMPEEIRMKLEAFKKGLIYE